MSPREIRDRTVQHVVQAPASELMTHAAIAIVIVISATVLGLHGELNSGDLLAVYTSALTGTAAVAGARASNRQVRRNPDADTDQ